jgi:hypothetical protein
MNSSPRQPSSLSERDRELLSAYLDQQLTTAERVNLERRLSAEPALQVELEDLRATTVALRQLEPLRPPRSFALDPAQVGRQRSLLPLSWFMQLGSGLAGLALVFLATAQLLGTGSLAPAAGGPASEMRAAATEAPPAAMQAPAEATAAPAAPESSMMQAPAATAAPYSAADDGPAGGVAGGPGSNSPAPETGPASSADAADTTAADTMQSSSSSSAETIDPAVDQPSTGPTSAAAGPGLTLALGIALLGLGIGWNLLSRRR